MQLRHLLWAVGLLGALVLLWSGWHFSLDRWPLLLFLAVIHALFSLAFTFPLGSGRHLNTGFVLALTGVFALPPAEAVLAAVPGMALVLFRRRLGLAHWITYIGSVSMGLLTGGWIWRTWGTSGPELRLPHVPAALLSLAAYHLFNVGIVSLREKLTGGPSFRADVRRYLADIGWGGMALSLFATPLGMELATRGLELGSLFYLAALAGAAELTRVYIGRQELIRQAWIDGLTGAMNRAAWQSTVEKLTARGMPEGLLVILDVNGLKAVNDQHGHAAGDEVLRDLVRSVRRVLRQHDEIYRYGGDEFVLYLLGVDARSSALARIQSALADLASRWLARGVQVGVSVGYAQAPREGRQFPILFELADRRMYNRKQRSGD